MSNDAAATDPVRLRADTPRSANPQFKGIMARELASALLSVARIGRTSNRFGRHVR